jgi:hypothetical protein
MRLQTKRKMVARWLVNIAPLFLVCWKGRTASAGSALRLRKGVASAGSIVAAEEGYGCEGGYSWASGLARFWLLLVQATVQQKWCC